MKISILEKLKVYELLFGGPWNHQIHGVDFEVLGWLLRATVGYGNTEGFYSYRQMREGIQNRKGGMYLHGMGYSDYQLRSAVSRLTRLGVLTLLPPSFHGGKPGYRVNLAWRPNRECTTTPCPEMEGV